MQPARPLSRPFTVGGIAAAPIVLSSLFFGGCGSDAVTVESLSMPRPGSVSSLSHPSGGATGTAAPPVTAPVTAPGARSGPIASDPEVTPTAERAPAPRAEAPGSAIIEPWNFAETQGRLHRTDHFLIHSTLTDGSLERTLSLFSERALERYRSELGALPPPERPLQTYIFGSRPQWERFTRDRLGANAGPYLAMGKGGFTTEGHAILYDIGRFDTLTILAHEGWHQYTQTTFKHPLPLWLEEGIACWMEAVRPGRGEGSSSPFLPWRNYERFGELRNGVRADMLIPLEALLDQSPEQFLRQGKDRLLLYYAQVWALVHFLNEGEDGRYAEALRQLVSDAAEGRLAGRMANSQAFPNPRARSMHLHSRVGKWVLLEYFNPRFAEFKSQYERFLREVTSPNASRRVWQGRSPLPESDARSDS